jgi:hypothetical protein
LLILWTEPDDHDQSVASYRGGLAGQLKRNDVRINWCQIKEGVAQESGKHANLKNPKMVTLPWVATFFNRLTLLSRNLAGYRIWLR